MADSTKDTIYIDIDDEITTIIDKLQRSDSKVVALVLPKRAAALQSIVNMKLLKRSSEQSNKNLVLITSETGLLPLAGAVGLHVAKTPTSRPEVPPAPILANDDTIDVAELDESAGSTPIGELAAAAAMPLPPEESGVETVELDNSAPLVAAKPLIKKLPKKDKKLQVPNFNKFRLYLILSGVLLVVLIVGGYIALKVLPTAVINVQTNASTVNTDIDLTLSTAATALNKSTNTVPAKRVQTQKTATGNAPATGQKNNGEKAHGQVTLSSACSNGIQTVPSGTGVSSSGQTFITQRDVTLSNASGGRTNCTFSGTVEITAQTGGVRANIADNSTFSVASSSSGSYVSSSISGKGSAAGGTDDIQTVVSQADIDSAKSKIADAANDVQQELSDMLDDQGLFAVPATYAAGTPDVTTSQDVGDDASTVIVTQTITYTMFGAKESDFKTLIDTAVRNQIDTDSQGILSQGLTAQAFKLTAATTNGASVNLQTEAVVGPTLDTADLAQQVAGKKSGDIKSTISATPGVTNVEVTLSPFWVTKAPGNLSKITVNVAKPTNSPSNGN